MRVLCLLCIGACAAAPAPADRAARVFAVPIGSEGDIIAILNETLVALLLIADSHRCEPQPLLELKIDAPGRIRATGDPTSLDEGAELISRLITEPVTKPQ